MKAVMLAAGTGSRLSGGSDGPRPKCLLSFDGRTLLQRHVDTLIGLGIEALTLVVGYRSSDIEHAVRELGAGNFVRLVENPRYRRGSVVSLWAAREVLRGGSDILFMDADVLYAPALLERLLKARSADCFAFDRDLEPGEEPVKLCLDDGRPVDFGKRVSGTYDVMGEWIGFLKLSPERAAELAAVLERFVSSDRLDAPCEDALRELLLTAPPGTFGVCDVTGLPWIEIDFPEDVARAEAEILPAIRAAN